MRHKLLDVMSGTASIKGGPGSGFHGHEGRPGQRGGSIDDGIPNADESAAPSGGVSLVDEMARSSTGQDFVSSMTDAPTAPTGRAAYPKQYLTMVYKGELAKHMDAAEIMRRISDSQGKFNRSEQKHYCVENVATLTFDEALNVAYNLDDRIGRYADRNLTPDGYAAVRAALPGKIVEAMREHNLPLGTQDEIRDSIAWMRSIIPDKYFRETQTDKTTLTEVFRDTERLLGSEPDFFLASDEGEFLGARLKGDTSSPRGQQGVDEVRNGMAAIKASHRIPGGLNVTVTLEDLNASGKSNTGGEYHPKQRDMGGDTRGGAIVLNTTAPYTATNFVHEFGHKLDFEFLSVSSDDAPGSPELRAAIGDYWKAVNSSAAYSGMRDVATGGVGNIPDIFSDYAIAQRRRDLENLARGYHMDRSEIWARSYAQYVSTNAASFEGPVGKQFAEQVRIRSSVYTRGHTSWDSNDFAPIAKAIYNIFAAAGITN